MAWEIVKHPFQNGGLGVRSLVELNIVLQGKWLNKFMREMLARLTAH